MGLRDKRKAKNEAGIAKGKARAERANQADKDLEAKAKAAGHGVKLTRKEVKALQEKDKNAH